MREVEGRSVDVPVVTVVDGSTAGVDLTQLADRTASFAQPSPGRLGLFVSLSGGTSVTLVVYVKVKVTGDVELGWARASDTGNLGVLSGKTLPSNDSYIFLVQHAAIYEELVLLALNNIGGVSVDVAKLIEYGEYLPKTV